MIRQDFGVYRMKKQIFDILKAKENMFSVSLLATKILRT